MKKTILFFCTIALLSCSSDDGGNNANCNFLLNVSVNLPVNLNLPQFSQLQFTNNAVRVEGQGNNGIIIIRTIGDNLMAWDGADPNVPQSSCSALMVNGTTAISSCENANTYDLNTGQIIMGDNSQPCTLKSYRVESVGNNSFVVRN